MTYSDDLLGLLPIGEVVIYDSERLAERIAVLSCVDQETAGVTGKLLARTGEAVGSNEPAHPSQQTR